MAATPATFVSAASAAATTAAMPAHQVGNLVIGFITRDGSTTAPTVPTAGGTVPAWKLVSQGTSTSCIAQIYVFTATANNHTTGTWANATGVAIVVVDGAAGFNVSSAQTGTGTTLTYPALTLVNATGPSRGLRFGFGRSVTDLTSGNPSGYTGLTGVATELRILQDSSGTLTSNPTAGNQTVTGSGAWICYTMEVIGDSSDATSDSFSSTLDSTLWAVTSSGIGGSGSAATSSGELVLNLTNASGGSRTTAIDTNVGFELTDGTSISFKVVHGTNSTNVTSSVGLWRSVPGATSAASVATGMGVDFATNVASAVYTINGTRTVVATRTHIANTWYRIKNTAGTIYWEYSTDGVNWNAWTNSVSAPAVLGVARYLVTAITTAVSVALHFDEFVFQLPTATNTTSFFAMF